VTPREDKEKPLDGSRGSARITFMPAARFMLQIGVRAMCPGAEEVCCMLSVIVYALVVLWSHYNSVITLFDDDIPSTSASQPSRSAGVIALLTHAIIHSPSPPSTAGTIFLR
jgi:hypothetical protein